MTKKPISFKYTAISVSVVNLDLDKSNYDLSEPATFIEITKTHAKDYSLHSRFGFRVLWVLGLLRYKD